MHVSEIDDYIAKIHGLQESINYQPPTMTAESSQADSLALDTNGAKTVTHQSQNSRVRTNAIEIDDTIIHPGSVKINVEGAFIVDQEGRSLASPLAPSPNGGSHDTKDIRLPNHTAVVSHIAVDIGGSLAKLVYFSREPHSTEPGGRLNFMNFETDRIDDCISFMKYLQQNQQKLNGSRPGELCVMATGGGAFKYYDKIREALGTEVLREEEMECLIIGLDFFITEIPMEVFTYSETQPMQFCETTPSPYPYLLVNIGSGVSMIKVSGPRKFKRVGGTSLGGGTLWGLLSLLTGARTFDEMLGHAERGDNANVDMLVGDIYGTSYDKIGLKSTAIASSFGKVFRMKREAEREAEDSGGLTNGDVDHLATAHLDDGQPPIITNGDSSISTSLNEDSTKTTSNTKSFGASDISRSLLYAISNNIGQIAYLQSEKHDLLNIYFGGSFIRGHKQTMNTLSYAIKFWSEGKKKAYFLRHEGYLGSVGAFLKRQPENWGRRGSFEDASALGERLRMRGGPDDERV